MNRKQHEQRVGGNSPRQVAAVLIGSVFALILFGLFIGGPDTYDPASPHYDPDRHTCGMECQDNHVSRSAAGRAAYEANQ